MPGPVREQIYKQTNKKKASAFSPAHKTSQSELLFSEGRGVWGDVFTEALTLTVIRSMATGSTPCMGAAMSLYTPVNTENTDIITDGGVNSHARLARSCLWVDRAKQGKQEVCVV